jgi:hypothetical protein
MASQRDRTHRERDGLTPAEIDAEIAEALPERAAMSTVSLTNLDAAAGTVEAVGDGVSDSAVGATDATGATDVVTAPTEPTGTEPEDTAVPAEPVATAPEAVTTATPDETSDPVATTAEPTTVGVRRAARSGRGAPRMGAR